MRGCDLCGIACGPRPEERRVGDAEHAFCCAGCANVYTILFESGVIASGQDFRDTDLYRQSLKLGLISQPNRSAPQPSIPEDAEVRETALHVSGLWCMSCAWLIERALLAEPGIASAEVFFASDLLKVRYYPRYLPPGRIQEVVASLGYKVAGNDDRGEDAERRDLLLRLGVAAFVWLNVMTLSMALYVGYFERISDSVRRYLPFVLMALTAPAVFYSAWPVLRIAWLGLCRRTIRMETLLGLGILSAYAYSAAQAVTGGAHVYFDTSCAIVTLVLLGKLIERGAKERTARAVNLLYRMMPRKARLLVEGGERFVSIEALQPGEVFLVKPGERVPADGTVLEGRSYLDESVLSGESAPVPKNPGDRVVCGSLNASGILNVEATRVGAESTLGLIIRSVEAALGSRSQLERTVDRATRAFVPSVIVLAVLTFAGWTASTRDSGMALMHAVTVLLIACPCALGIATPLAITAAIGAASSRGILISDSRVLETVEKVDVVVLDKTGTVTEGDFRLIGFAGDSAAVALAAALEVCSEHPVGRALVRHAREEGWSLPQARHVTVRPGMGITGLVEGVSVFVGNTRMAETVAASLPAPFLECGAAWEQQGHAVAFFGCESEVRGVLALGDRIRPDAAALTRTLRERGIQTVIVSGDTPATTAWVAGRVGAGDFLAGVLPDEKVRVVREYQARGSVVAMVGDGVNDAPALAQADLGIAMGSGTDIAIKSAPVVLMGNSLGGVLETFDLARAALRTVRINLFWAFFYNAAAVTLAIAGVLNPILAAAAMVLSSLSVIGNSLRGAARFSPGRDLRAARRHRLCLRH